jgi:hypothetical protein
VIKAIWVYQEKKVLKDQKEGKGNQVHQEQLVKREKEVNLGYQDQSVEMDCLD